MARNSNSRVTIAVLGTKLDAIAGTLAEIKTGQTRQDDRIGNLETGQARLNERVSTWRVIQAAISAALAAAAGYIGTRN